MIQMFTAQPELPRDTALGLIIVCVITILIWIWASSDPDNKGRRRK